MKGDDNMTYKVILFDFDDTIVDFHDAEVHAYHYLMDQYDIPLKSRQYDQFKAINQAHWEAFQRGELTRQEVLSHRFVATFKAHNLGVDGVEADITFREGLVQAPIKYLPGVEEVVDQLGDERLLAIVTNGVENTQKRRLQKVSFNSLFKHIFISDELGVQKPKEAFFTKVFEALPEYKKEDFLIIGDSLTSDILGGQNAGIDTCWFNHRQQQNQTTIEPTYTIQNMNALHSILNKE